MTRHRVLVLDTKIANPNRYLPVALHRAFAADPSVGTAVLATYREAMAAAEAMRPTLLLAFGGEEIDHFLLHKLIRLSGRSAIWFTEDPYELSRNLASAELVDLVFTNDRASVARYGSKGHYLPLAGFEPFHERPLDPAGRRYDLFFAGTAWPNRVEMFQKLLAIDSGLRLKLFVPPSPFGGFSAEGGPNVSAQDIHVSGMDFARFASRSSATLYLTRNFSTSPGSPSMTPSPGPRFFETALAGGIQVYEPGTLDLPDGFVDGESVFPFRTLEELVDIVGTLRDDPAAWAAAAGRAQAVTREKHCYRHRVTAILERTHG
ncbi:MAG TPA: glycosyltransferase [Azospirillum sp.]|nr:glycosyltransferase [Azospirillum sp.]